MPKERIDKIISSQSSLSRSDAARLIKSGSVKISGKTVKSPSEKADALTDEIEIDGVRFVYKKHIYIMMNKPSGVVSASSCPTDRTVVDLIGSDLARQGLFPAGRLDKDTTGFVLITDDGDFAHRILSPKKHIPKTYHVTLKERVNGDVITAIGGGITVGGEEFSPAEVRPVSDTEPVYEVILTEGRYHEIKRMFARFGNEVTALKRVKMGGLELDDTLSEGAYREITAEELEALACNPIDK